MRIEPTTFRTAVTDDDKDYRLYRNDHNSLCNYSTSRRVRSWRILVHVITWDFCCFSQRAAQRAYIAHVVTGVWCDGVDMCEARVCAVCV